MKNHPVLREIARKFKLFNSYFFEDKITSTPDFNFSLGGKYSFRFDPDSFQILIGKDFLNVSDESLIFDLLHEMVHVYNYVTGRIDCRSNKYHNNYFLEAATWIGFVVCKHPRRGWCLTGADVSPASAEVVFPHKNKYLRLLDALKHMKFNRRAINRIKLDIESRKKRKNTVFFLKYECQCPPPHNSIRSGRRPDGKKPLRIICKDCNSEFKCTE